MFLFLAGILIAMGVVIAHYFWGTFSLGAWSGGLALFAFAWIGRSIATGEASCLPLTSSPDGGWRILNTLRSLPVVIPFAILFLQRVGNSFLREQPNQPPIPQVR